MRNARKLSLKRESLSALTTDDLTAVAGGQQELTHVTCGLCLTQVWSYDNCPTTPVNYCVGLIAIRTVRDCTTT